MTKPSDDSAVQDTSTIEDARLLTSISSSVAPASSPSPPAAAAAASAQDAGVRQTAVAPSAAPSSQQYVDHTYTDYANVDEDDLRITKGAAGGKSDGGAGGASGPKASLGMSCSFGLVKSKVHCGSVMKPFPGKLMDVLDRGDLSSIIDWMPHGRAFIVKQPKVFTAQVLPRFFKQTKFLSFTRQLNLWGFKRITRGLDAGAYYHELFLPGRPNLAMRMKRQKIKGTGIRPIPNPEQEPNFYYDYPQVPKAPKSSVPLPLPPLPSERIADLVGANRGAQMPLQHQFPTVVGSQSFLPPPTSGGLSGSAIGAAGLTLPNLRGNGLGATSLAANAELRLRGSMNHGILSNATVSSLLSNQQGSNVATHDPMYLRQQAASMTAAPRTFQPRTDARDTHDEISLANRRLMERLLDARTGGAPTLSTSGSDYISHRRPSYLGSIPREADLLSLSASASTPPARSLAHLTRPPTRKSVPLSSSSAVSGADISSLLSSYLPRAQPRPSLHAATSSTLPPQRSAPGVDVATVTKALRDARRLEEMARSQRAAAEVLAGALQRQGGVSNYDAVGDLLPSLGGAGQDFDDGSERSRRLR